MAICWACALSWTSWYTCHGAPSPAEHPQRAQTLKMSQVCARTRLEDRDSMWFQEELLRTVNEEWVLMRDGEQSNLLGWEQSGSSFFWGCGGRVSQALRGSLQVGQAMPPLGARSWLLGRKFKRVASWQQTELLTMLCCSVKHTYT